MTLKILSGKFKNRLLKTPKGTKTRPTSSKVRGSIFDSLQNQVDNADFLDLFAGSGSMGIEALSRGAKSATFIEKDRSAAACIRENLEMLGIEASVYQMDVFIALKLLLKKGGAFDLIYIDPPYELNIAPLIAQIPPLLSPEGILIVEQSKHAKLEAPLLQKIDEKKFGDTVLYFWHSRKKTTEQTEN